jgi:hypothetical protein
MSGIVRSNNTSQSGVVANVETIDSDDFVDGAIDAAHIASDAVTTVKILDANVTLAKIANSAANTVLVRDANSSGVVSAKAVATTEILIGDGTGFTAAALSGDVTMTNAGVVTLGTDAVDIAMLSASGTASSSTFLRGDNAWAAAGGGKIGQVVSVTKQDTFTTTSASFVDITGLTVDITPTATSSKVLVHFSVVGSQDVGVQRASYVLLRDSTAISVGTAAGSRTPFSGEFASSHESILNGPTGGVYLDSPSSTSALTYKIQARSDGTAFINRTDVYGDDSSTGNFASTIVVMEVLA